MMPAPVTMRRVSLLLWFLHGLFSYLFVGTQGLAYPNADNVFGFSYVKELQSSGANDNICIELGIIFAAIALLWGGLRTKIRFGLLDFVINFVLIGLQMLFLLSIELGSIAVTIIYGKNIVLTLWMLSYITLCGCLVGMSWLGITRGVHRLS